MHRTLFALGCVTAIAVFHSFLAFEAAEHGVSGKRFSVSGD
jgi:hypothetical protein